MALSMDPAILILAAALGLILYLYFREYNLRQKLEREGEEFLQDLREKGWETLHSSIAKSQDMLGQAELDSIKVMAEGRVMTQKMEEEYKKKLSEIIKQTETSINNSYKQLIQFMAELQKAGSESQQMSQNLAQARVNKLFDSLEQRLSDFLVETSQKTTSSIELELKSTRALIDTYKQEQLKLIDENILAMMEQTLSLVLNKKLSLEDHLDFVYEALEKAKVEKFIV